ncbi:hypothetical protein CA265_19235 [Sphingobacteriaceae bacterium GW460-11-11-14-LB5]|nr:hypothetical protein CA265_19235 [Sphingobacteriaceae bacterium GW460-11-11-14-LB5]
MFKRANFDELVNKSIPFFIVVCLYGISQKIFGYSPVEINWIQSGLSFADEREFIGGGDVRPFSTFASMPEFTLFIAIFLYYFTIEKKRWYIIFAVIMLYIAGSRGVFISTLIAYFFTFFVKRYSSWYLFLAFLASLTIFLCLVFVFPIIFNSQEETTRMLAYGTFNGRVELLNRVLETSSASYLFTGVDIKSMGLEPTFDNFYFMLTAHFGVFGGLYFLFFFLRPKVNKKNYYFFAIFLGYGFYADMVFSYYLMFLFFFAIYSYSDSLISTKSQLQTSLTPANNHLSNNIC